MKGTKSTQTTTTTEPKRNAAITATMDVADNGSDRLTLTFANGKELVITAADLSEFIARNALMHGLKQKLVDAAAISRNPDTGKAATVDDKYAAVKTVYDRLLAGQWNAPREGGGNTGGLLVRALVRMFGKTEAQIREFLAKKSDAEKAALRANPKVAAIIAEIQAESVADIDSDAMLGELE